jgi:putative addiction module component (TIGR02574 family)
MQAIENLTRSEKLRMMEALWDDLAHDAIELASPEWHADALSDAAKAVSEGQASFIDWEKAKQSLLNNKA